MLLEEVIDNTVNRNIQVDSEGRVLKTFLTIDPTTGHNVARATKIQQGVPVSIQPGVSVQRGSKRPSKLKTNDPNKAAYASKRPSKRGSKIDKRGSKGTGTVTLSKNGTGTATTLTLPSSPDNSKVGGTRTIAGLRYTEQDVE